MPLIDSLWKSIGWESILDDPYMKAGILSSVLNQGELFPAFSGAYMKASFGSVMFSIPVRWEGAPRVFRQTGHSLQGIVLGGISSGSLYALRFLKEKGWERKKIPV